MITTIQMSNEQIIEVGMDIMVQCIKFNVIDELDKPHITLQLNILGVLYGVQVPKHEIQEQNIIDAWKQIIEQFGVMHMKGQKYNIQDGSRELTDEEHKALAEGKKKKHLTLLDNK